LTTASGCDDPPSLGPLEIAREIPALPRAPIRGPSPGHQAGAPLRQLVGELVGGLHIRRRCPTGDRYRTLLPPAIRPGLHCGHHEPAPAPRCASPGHQAAPLPRGVAALSYHLPPAIRPGLHCFGGSRLPPAIRPGLHCGRRLPPATCRGSIAAVVTDAASPGHQAGAPLRRNLAFPRPSGRGSIAAERSGLFPRPSGRGSIAALPAGWRSWYIRRPSPGHSLRPLSDVGTFVELPPAIRPGLHCARPTRIRPAPLRPSLHLVFPRPSGRGSIAASPGHQAGAPAAAISAPMRTSFPRPSGRGSIAAMPSRSNTRPPGGFPRPSGRGSIAAVRRPAALVRCPSFPRPSGRGSIAALASMPTAPGRLLPPAIRPGLHCGAGVAGSTR
jgi:hypothetical protein